VIGVDRDEVTVLGLAEGVDAKKERDRVGQLIRTRVQPTPPFEVTDQVIEGKTVLFVEVQTGAAPPTE
jgi:predicted HTH transcriptional regulator